VLSPRDVTGPHIRFLAAIGQIMNEHGRTGLLACRTAEDMYAFLTSLGAGPKGRRP
jgi:mannitol/fructose-specific phosphotransferase system IIA component (Ntr-type)